MKRLLLLLATTTLALSACGSSGSKSTAAATSTTVNRAAAFQAYSACLSQHGVNFPAGTGPGMGMGGTGRGTNDTGPNGGGPNGTGADGGGTGGTAGMGRPPVSLPPGVDQKTYDAARTACQSKLPQGAMRNGQGGPQFQAYASCLKDHGVNIDPTNAQQLGQIDRTTDTFKAADTACAPLRPQATAGRPGGTGPGGTGSSTTTTTSTAS